MEIVDYFQDSLNIPFTEDGKTGLLSIHPEMRPFKKTVTFTGRYCIYCMHPRHGSCTFHVGQNESNEWISDFHAPFITTRFIEWLGDRIERNGK